MDTLLFLNLGVPEMFLISIILVLPLICLVDIIRSEFKDNTTKLLWILIVLVAPFVGPVIYLIIGRSQKNLTA